MINRVFNELKFSRTYIGGSKENEIKTFLKVMGNKEDNSECDWIEYKTILIQYFDDIIHIILSWRIVTRNISYLLIFLFFISLITNIPLAIGIAIVAICLRIISALFYLKQQKRLSIYDQSLNVIFEMIKKQTGLELSNNLN